MVRLVFQDKKWTEGKAESGEAILTIDEANGTARLEFNAGAGLIARRTAKRQADSICRSGHVLANGRRVKGNVKLETDDDSIDERLLQEGHKYR